jgi:predicted MPP superfamily phosphohydrolase
MGVGGLILAALGLGGYIYTTKIEPIWLEAVRIPVYLPRLDAAFDGFRLVQISDIHMGGWMNRKRLAHVVDAILAEEPDAVAITGDFLCEQDPEERRSLSMKHMSAELMRLSAYCPTFAVMGNHDYWEGVHMLRRVLRYASVIELPNTFYTINREGASLHLCGVDDTWVGRANLKMLLEALPAAGAAILLVHEPDFADTSAATGRFDLQLAGHTHGGQIRFFGRHSLISAYLGRKYPAGLYRVGAMQEYTNRGVGMGIFEARLNCRPEITVLTLHPAA